MLIQENGFKGAPLWADDPREGDGPYRTNEAPIIRKKKKKRKGGN
jgi:hypothetical protein